MNTTYTAIGSTRNPVTNRIRPYRMVRSPWYSSGLAGVLGDVGVLGHLVGRRLHRVDPAGRVGLPLHQQVDLVLELLVEVVLPVRELPGDDVAAGCLQNRLCRADLRRADLATGTGR